MNWQEHIFIYCERGQNPAFWAEPLNALTNLLFIVAALAALPLLRAHRSLGWNSCKTFLVTTVFIIGVGSFLFHTFATRWGAIADDVPIGVFVFSYLTFALLVFVRLSGLVTAAIMAAFVPVFVLAGMINCPNDAVVTIGGPGPACLRGSVAYLPALAALGCIALILWSRSHAAASLVAAACGCFTLSLIVRTLDVPLCSLTEIAGRTIGTHFIWHTLNATTLYLLLRAALLHGTSSANTSAALAPHK